VLVPTFRNDVGAPRSPDGQQHLGGTEWRDVEAAVRWAVDRGARDVVLLGWSMGAAVSLQLVDRSPLGDRVRGLVLDSPVLDWTSVLDHQGRRRNLPDPVTKVAEWMVGLRLGTGLDRFDWVGRARDLRRPMLVVHSGADDYVPNGPSLALARARPDLVTYVDVPGAGHTRGWNVDEARYRAALDAWFTRQGL
jgi:pimeloyl-ACP methyl ester carboxylesterase